jgi:putative MFS transporter
VPIVALLAWQLVPIAPFGLDGWRWVVLIGAAGALFAWMLRRGIPESARWEENRRRAAKDGNARGSFGEIWHGRYLKRTIMLILFHVFQTVGYYGFSNWVPTLLISQGINITTSLRYTFIIAIAAPFGPMLGALLADRIERKWLIVASAAGVAIFGVAFGFSSEGFALVLLGAAITLCNNIMSLAFHAYQAELYPTRIRARAVGFVYSWSRLSAVFSSFVIAFILHDFGTGPVFLFIAGCMAIVTLAVGILGPKTNNMALETISE